MYEEAERHAVKDQNYIFKNPRWRRAAILKIINSPYLSKTLSNFDEIWYTTADSATDDSEILYKEAERQAVNGQRPHDKNCQF